MIAATLKQPYIVVPAITILALPAIVIAGLLPQLSAILLWHIGEFVGHFRIVNELAVLGSL